MFDGSFCHTHFIDASNPVVLCHCGGAITNRGNTFESHCTPSLTLYKLILRRRGDFNGWNSRNLQRPGDHEAMQVCQISHSQPIRRALYP